NALLEKAHGEISAIPTVIDRLERIIVLAEAWDTIKDTESVRYLLSVASESMNAIRHLEYDEQLSKIVQTANKLLGGDFAATLLNQLDSYREGGNTRTKLRRTLQVDKLSKNPSALVNWKDAEFNERRDIIGTVATQLLDDIVAGMGRGIETDD